MTVGNYVHKGPTLHFGYYVVSTNVYASQITEYHY